MTNLSKDELASLVAAVVTQIMQGQTTAPKAATAKPHFLPKGSKASADDLAGKDQRLIAAFTRKGFRDVALMDRNDPSKDYNVRPFQGWLKQGRIVRRGQKGVRGLFHVTQTDPLPVKAAAITGEQKQLFAKAKAALKAKQTKGKPQPTLV